MLPLRFLRFWFVDFPNKLIIFFVSLNNAFLQLFSLPLLIKTWVIVADVILLLLLLLLEFLFIISFISWPVLTVLLYKDPILFFLSVLWILAIFSIFKPKKSWVDYISGKSTQQIIKELLSRQDISFVLQKAEIAKSEVQLIDFSKE